MTMSARLLDRGIRLWKDGQRMQARRIFETVVFNDRQNESAWVWYIYTLDTDPEKIAALEDFLSIFPRHATGMKVLANLRKQEKQSPVQEAHPAPVRQIERSIPRARQAPVQQPRPVQKSQPSFVPWILVALGLCIFLFSSAAFLTSYNSLQAQYKSVVANRNLISKNFEALNREYQALQSEHHALADQHNSLASKYSSLNNEYSTLQANYNTLSTEHVNLQNDYDLLLNDYNDTSQAYADFREVAIAPPYIYLRGREAHLAFLTPNQETYRWRVPFDLFERDLERGNAERNKISFDPEYPRIVLRNTNNGESYPEIDYRRFVDPSPFMAFSRYFYDRAFSEEAFISEIWYIVAQLTAYSSEITDTPRYPLETLLAGGGDCEDHAILFASMILAAAPQDWKVDLVYMDSDHPTEPQTINHMIVYIETQNRPYTIEATGKQIMEPYVQGVNGWYTEIED